MDLIPSPAVVVHTLAASLKSVKRTRCRSVFLCRQIEKLGYDQLSARRGINRAIEIGVIALNDDESLSLPKR